jgi:hypothetical protein
MNLVVEKAKESQSEAQISHGFDGFSGLPRLTSSMDILTEVTYKLGAARSAAQRLLDRDLVYFIDMAIFQACEMLSSVRDTTECDGQAR